MRILLAVDERTDARIVSAYLVERFGGQPCTIDIVTVMPSATATATRPGDTRGVVSHQLPQERAQRRAQARVMAVTTELEERYGLSDIHATVEVGEPARVLLAACARLRSDVIVLESRRQHGLFSRLRLASTTRRILAAAPCAVELIKPHAATPRSLFNVLVPIAAEALPHFPLTQLAAWPWPDGTRLQLLALLPPNAEETRLEASAPRVYAAMEEARSARYRAERLLGSACDELRAALPHTVDLEHDVVRGQRRRAIFDAATRLRAALIVLAHPHAGPDRLARTGRYHRARPARPCPALVLERRPRGCAGPDRGDGAEQHNRRPTFAFQAGLTRRPAAQKPRGAARCIAVTAAGLLPDKDTKDRHSMIMKSATRAPATRCIRALACAVLVGLAGRAQGFEQLGDAALSSGLPHIPEPMVFDLVRPLGVKQGEFEMNALMQYAPRSGEIEWAPEIEYGVVDGFAVEFELPFSSSTLEEYKFALQGTLGGQGAYVHGWQVIARRARSAAEYSVDGLYIAGYSWPGRTSVLGMVGVRSAGIGHDTEHRALLNGSWFLDLSAPLTLGVELNVEAAARTDFLVMPQLHADLDERVTAQVGVGRRGGGTREHGWELAGRFIVTF